MPLLLCSYKDGIRHRSGAKVSRDKQAVAMIKRSKKGTWNGCRARPV